MSATIGEEIAVAAMQQGAADFVIKDRMARLGPAAAHALEQRRLREENRRAREALRRNEELSHRILAMAGDLKEVTPRYEKLSALAHELAVTPEQAAAVEAAEAPVRDYVEAKLVEMVSVLAELPASGAPQPSADRVERGRTNALLAALQETIGVLHQTKRSFKSRTLAQLRERLETLMQTQGQRD